MTACAAALLSLLFDGSIETFLSSLIGVQAVIVGFAFSVVFFLLSVPPAPGGHPDSVEDKLSLRKLEKLADELFANVSYFILVGMLGLASAVVLLAPDLPSFAASAINRPRPDGIDGFVRGLSLAGRYFFLFATAFLTLESGYTFARTVGRVWFLFSERTRLVNTHPSRT